MYKRQEELQAARTSVEDLQSAVETADWSMESYNYGSDLAVTLSLIHI